MYASTRSHKFVLALARVRPQLSVEYPAHDIDSSVPKTNSKWCQVASTLQRVIVLVTGGVALASGVAPCFCLLLSRHKLTNYHKASRPFSVA